MASPPNQPGHPSAGENPGRQVAELPVDRIGRYKLVDKIGAGGMGEIFLGEDESLNRKVALKILPAAFTQDADRVRRFELEAKAASALNHPNIITIYEIGEADGVHYIVTEYIQGNTLRQQMVDGLTIERSLDVGSQIASALKAAHEVGIVHRDIKPENVMVRPDGLVKVLDFGIAKLIERPSAQQSPPFADQETASLSEFYSTKVDEAKYETTPDEGLNETAAGIIMGTVTYMSPEQLRGQKVDARADIFSLGVLLYEVIAGTSPFAGDTQVDRIAAILEREPAPLTEHRPDTPRGLEPIVSKALCKDRDNRYQLVGDLLDDLKNLKQDLAFQAKLEQSSPVGARGHTAPTRRPETEGLEGVPHKNRLRLPAIASLALLIVAAVFFYWFLNRPGARHGAVAGGQSIKVGVLHSRSGTMASDERPVIDATVFAVEEINAAGGLLGRRVEAIIEDGQSDAQTFAVRAEKLIVQDKVSTIFGCWTSASRKAVKEVVEKHNHLLIYPVQNEGLEESPNIVYLGAAPNQQIIPAVRWCASFLKKKRLFLVGSDYIFPRAANAIIRDQVKSLGVEVVGEEYRPLGSSDMTQIVEKIRSSKAEVILNTINGDTNIAFFRALRAAGISSSDIPTISFSVSENSLSSMRPQDLAGDYAVWNYFQGIDYPQNKEFVSRFQQRFGIDRIISDPMEAAYAGVQVWAKAVKASGSEDAAVIRSALAGQVLDAPEGKILLDPTTMRTFKFIRIARMSREGRFEMIYSSDVAIEPIPYPGTRPRAAWDSFLTGLQRGWGGKWESPGR